MKVIVSGLMVMAFSSMAMGDIVAWWRMEDEGESTLRNHAKSGELFDAQIREGGEIRSIAPKMMIHDGAGGVVDAPYSFYNTESSRGAVLTSEASDRLRTVFGESSFTIEAIVQFQYSANYRSIFRGDQWLDFGTTAKEAFAFSARGRADKPRIASGPILAAKKWLHVAAVGTFDGTDTTVQLFLDGEAVGEPVEYFGGLEIADDAPFSIGGPNGFPGLIHQVRISDEALSAAQFLSFTGGAPKE